MLINLIEEKCLPLSCVPVEHGMPTWLNQSLMLPLCIVTLEVWMPLDPILLRRSSLHPCRRLCGTWKLAVPRAAGASFPWVVCQCFLTKFPWFSWKSPETLKILQRGSFMSHSKQTQLQSHVFERDVGSRCQQICEHAQRETVWRAAGEQGEAWWTVLAVGCSRGAQRWRAVVEKRGLEVAENVDEGTGGSWA